MDDEIMDDVVGTFDTPKQPLPNAQTSFILGILSVVPGCLCSCLGVILGVIGLVLGMNALKEYDSNPAAYSEADYKNAKNGSGILEFLSRDNFAKINYYVINLKLKQCQAVFGYDHFTAKNSKKYHTTFTFYQTYFLQIRNHQRNAINPYDVATRINDRNTKRKRFL